MLKFYIFVGVVIGIVFVLKLITNNSPEKEEGKKKSLYKYKRKDFLISRPEHEFFDILVDITRDQYYVFPQIHLSTILYNKIVGQNWNGAFRHIDEKSVDFVICDKAYIKPILAIELDDKTHEKEDRKGRDGEVEQMLKEAGMPLLRFGNNGFFNKEEIKKIVLENLK